MTGPARPDHDVPLQLTDAAILSQLFTDSPVPIAIYDVSGAPRRANDAHDTFVRALGDGAGIGAYNVLSDLRSHRMGHRQYFQRAASGEVVDYEFTVAVDNEPEGVACFYRLLTPARDATGSVVAVASVILDVSDAKRDATDRERMHAQLLQSQKLESLGLLAGGIAHDFNNLLVGVLGNASMLLQRLALDSPLRRHAQAIETAARRASDVARQMLAYAGKGRFSIEDVDLSELVKESAELLHITIARRAELRQELDLELPSVRADVTQLRQIIMNLITNAREAVGEAGGVIVIRTGLVEPSPELLANPFGEPDPDAAGFAYVEVEDTGCGLDDETLAKIFDPFFTTKFTGRGLGLSAVRGIVESHRGAMQVESTPGKGTRMRVLFPVDDLGVHHRQRLSPQPDAPSDAAVRIMVVDDEEAVRSVLGDMLEALGHIVTRASRGTEALELLDRAVPPAQVVLLDLTMPGQSGSTTFEEIRSRHPDVRVIFMSGYASQAVPDASGFLAKPFTVAELEMALRRALTQER